MNGIHIYIEFNRVKTLNVQYSASNYAIGLPFTGMIYWDVRILYTKYLGNLKFFIN